MKGIRGGRLRSVVYEGWVKEGGGDVDKWCNGGVGYVDME